MFLRRDAECADQAAQSQVQRFRGSSGGGQTRKGLMEYVSCRKQVAVAPENASFTGGHRTTLRPSHQAVEAQAENERWRC